MNIVVRIPIEFFSVEGAESTWPICRVPRSAARGATLRIEQVSRADTGAVLASPTALFVWYRDGRAVGREALWSAEAQAERQENLHLDLAAFRELRRLDAVAAAFAELGGIDLIVRIAEITTFAFLRGTPLLDIAIRLEAGGAPTLAHLVGFTPLQPRLPESGAGTFDVTLATLSVATEVQDVELAIASNDLSLPSGLTDALTRSLRLSDSQGRAIGRSVVTSGLAGSTTRISDFAAHSGVALWHILLNWSFDPPIIEAIYGHLALAGRTDLGLDLDIDITDATGAAIHQRLGVALQTLVAEPHLIIRDGNDAARVTVISLGSCRPQSVALECVTNAGNANALLLTVQSVNKLLGALQLRLRDVDEPAQGHSETFDLHARSSEAAAGLAPPTAIWLGISAEVSKVLSNGRDVRTTYVVEVLERRLNDVQVIHTCELRLLIRATSRRMCLAIDLGDCGTAMALASQGTAPRSVPVSDGESCILPSDFRAGLTPGAPDHVVRRLPWLLGAIGFSLQRAPEPSERKRALARNYDIILATQAEPKPTAANPRFAFPRSLMTAALPFFADAEHADCATPSRSYDPSLFMHDIMDEVRLCWLASETSAGSPMTAKTSLALVHPSLASGAIRERYRRCGIEMLRRAERGSFLTFDVLGPALGWRSDAALAEYVSLVPASLAAAQGMLLRWGESREGKESWTIRLLSVDFGQRGVEFCLVDAEGQGEASRITSVHSMFRLPIGAEDIDEALLQVITASLRRLTATLPGSEVSDEIGLVPPDSVFETDRSVVWRDAVTNAKRQLAERCLREDKLRFYWPAKSVPLSVDVTDFVRLPPTGFDAGVRADEDGGARLEVVGKRVQLHLAKSTLLQPGTRLADLLHFICHDMVLRAIACGETERSLPTKVAISGRGALFPPVFEALQAAAGTRGTALLFDQPLTDARMKTVTPEGAVQLMNSWPQRLKPFPTLVLAGAVMRSGRLVRDPLCEAARWVPLPDLQGSGQIQPDAGQVQLIALPPGWNMLDIMSAQAASNDPRPWLRLVDRTIRVLASWTSIGGPTVEWNAQLLDTGLAVTVAGKTIVIDL